MAFQEIAARLSVTTSYGSPGKNQTPTRTAPFVGGHLSSFYAKHGVELKYMRQALRASRVGSVYELPTGRSLIIPYDE